jgi:hypothetical protein
VKKINMKTIPKFHLRAGITLIESQLFIYFLNYSTVLCKGVFHSFFLGKGEMMIPWFLFVSFYSLQDWILRSQKCFQVRIMKLRKEFLSSFWNSFHIFLYYFPPVRSLSRRLTYVISHLISLWFSVEFDQYRIQKKNI